MIAEKTIDTANGFQFNSLVSGDQAHKPVFFLHGFPETSYMWRGLMADITKEGFFCVAPDLRGLSPGARPKGSRNYSVDELIHDVSAIAESLGIEKFHLVGHDWGAAIGWKLVHDFPERVLSWTAISVPHLQAFGEAIVNDPQQRKMSAYIRAFQIPWLPELNLRKKDFALFRKLWKHSTADEVEAYLKVFRQKGALTAALNYYRGNYRLLKQAAREQVMGQISTPTLFIYGNKDIAIGASAVANGHQYLKGPYEYLELDDGHWLVQTSYEDIQTAILRQLQKYSQEASI